MPHTPTPHDHLFIKVFSAADNAASFLSIFLPDALQQLLAFNTTTILHTTRISNQLEKRTSDVILSMKTRDHIEEMVFLLEHKSYYDQETDLQIQRYILRINEQDYAENKLIRPVIPIVFYHGAEKWKRSRPAPDFSTGVAELDSLFSRHAYLLFDTRNWSLADPRNGRRAHKVYLLSAMHLMKHVSINGLSMVSSMIDYWKTTGHEPSEDEKTALFEYIITTSDIAFEQIHEILQRYQEAAGELIMVTLAERLRQEGELRGIEKGKIEGKAEGKAEGKSEGKAQGKAEQTLYFAKKLLQEGHEIAYVARLTELSVEQVKKLNGTAQ